MCLCFPTELSLFWVSEENCFGSVFLLHLIWHNWLFGGVKVEFIAASQQIAMLIEELAAAVEEGLPPSSPSLCAFPFCTSLSQSCPSCFVLPFLSLFNQLTWKRIIKLSRYFLRRQGGELTGGGTWRTLQLARVGQLRNRDPMWKTREDGGGIYAFCQQPAIRSIRHVL